MNQTKKRLAIIELAISITDIEAIRLQLLRLQPLRSDEKIHEILSLLEDENYAQAQALITTYIQTPTQTVIQRIPEEEQAIIDEFDFLEIKPDTIEDTDKEIRESDHTEAIEITKETIEKQADITILVDETFEISESSSTPEISSPPIKEEIIHEEIIEKNNNTDKETNKTSTNVNDFDTLLNMDADDILSKNIKIDLSEKVEPTYKKEKIDFNLNTIPKDSFFDTLESTVSKETEDIDISSTDEIEVKTENQFNRERDDFFTQEESNTLVADDKKSKIEKIDEKEETLADIVKDIETPQFTNEDTLSNLDETIITPKPKAKIENTPYNAMSHIHHKLQDLQQAYPPVHETNEPYSEELEAWLEIISEKGYTESDVEEVLKHIEKLAHSDKAQAALFLLATSATQSQYAQFILSRALYRGTLLQRNLDESFRIMSQLAFRDKYPEAICDLAQFYENGIAVDKDKTQAKLLYKEAMELGIQRAVNHYARLMKEPKGLFSFFKK
jgi:L-fucose mutarotase/ribose pyranase (RbsD/FucU family)